MPTTAMRRKGFSLVGMLITLVCMVVLFSILINALGKAKSGLGTQQPNTIDSFEDKLYLDQLFKSLAVYAVDNKGRFLVPSDLTGSNNPAENTTANFFSAVVMHCDIPCKQLISGNEYSGYVFLKEDYDQSYYNPAKKSFWDPTFVADLGRGSNVSFGHMPLFGQRLQRQWTDTYSSSFPLIGNRGPQDGVNSINSLACGRDGVWRGHMVFGDGHVSFIDQPILAKSTGHQSGQGDNVFKMETGPNGMDAIIAFTRELSRSGPTLQFD